MSNLQSIAPLLLFKMESIASLVVINMFFLISMVDLVNWLEVILREGLLFLLFLYSFCSCLGTLVHGYVL